MGIKKEEEVIVNKEGEVEALINKITRSTPPLLSPL